MPADWTEEWLGKLLIARETAPTTPPALAFFVPPVRTRRISASMAASTTLECAFHSAPNTQMTKPQASMLVSPLRPEARSKGSWAGRGRFRWMAHRSQAKVAGEAWGVVKGWGGCRVRREGRDGRWCTGWEGMVLGVGVSSIRRHAGR